MTHHGYSSFTTLRMWVETEIRRPSDSTEGEEEKCERIGMFEYKSAGFDEFLGEIVISLVHEDLCFS